MTHCKRHQRSPNAPFFQTSFIMITFFYAIWSRSVAGYERIRAYVNFLVFSSNLVNYVITIIFYKMPHESST